MTTATDTRTRMERARDEMPSDQYEALLSQALELIMNQPEGDKTCVSPQYSHR